MSDAGGAGARWSWPDTFAGVIPPLITPLDRAGHVDTAAARALVDYTLAGGCSGLFVVGGCGMGPWLTMAQRGETIRAMVAAAAGKAPVLVGVMLPGTGPAREAARQAAAEGADALVVGSPYYYGLDADGQRRHVEAVLAAVDLPVLLYNIPQCTRHGLHEAVAALAREPRVLGIKDSSGDLAGFQRFLSIKGQRPDFGVLQGDERVMAASLLADGDGLIPGLANVAPHVFVDLARAARLGDIPACQRLQERITDLWSLFAHGHDQPLAALVSACAVLGLGSGQPVEPYARLGGEQQQAVAAILHRHGLREAATAGRA